MLISLLFSNMLIIFSSKATRYIKPLQISSLSYFRNNLAIHSAWILTAFNAFVTHYLKNWTSAFAMFMDDFLANLDGNSTYDIPINGWYTNVLIGFYMQLNCQLLPRSIYVSSNFIILLTAWLYNLSIALNFLTLLGSFKTNGATVIVISQLLMSMCSI